MNARLRSAAPPSRRVCIVLPFHWSASVGGAEMQVRLLAERLRARGVADLHLVVRHADPGFVPEGHRLHVLPRRRSLCGTFPLDAPALLARLDAISPDVVYQRVACTYTGVAAHWARSRGRRLVWHVCSDDDVAPLPAPLSWRTPLRSLDRRAIRHGTRHAHRIVVQTRWQAERLRELHGRGDARVIRNFHPRPAEPPAKPRDRLVVAWVANLKPNKRPELFVRLARDCRDLPGVEFAMIGALQMDAAEWRRVRDREGPAPNLHEVGPLSPEAVNEALAAAHLLVNTSVYEGYPNTFIQAWLREVAVASLRVDPDGVFADAGCGDCAGDDYARLLAIVRRHATDAEFRHQRARRALAYAREHHSEANADALADLLLEDR